MSLTIQAMLPELVLGTVACMLILLGVVNRAGARRLSAGIAFLTLVGVFVWQYFSAPLAQPLADPTGTFRVWVMAAYVKLLASGVGAIFVLLAWPSGPGARGNAALDFGQEAGEFYGLMLLSIAGVFLVAGANDIVLLFLGIELASIPTYIMVSISRPLAVAQEAGVKYFFLGAMSAAIMLFGFSYLYGSTGMLTLVGTPAHDAVPAQQGIVDLIARDGLTPWQTLAAVMLIAGFAFKIAAVPLHVYAGDVYQGAATPVTAFLSFVPKTSGMIALVKVLFVLAAGTFVVPAFLVKLLWVLAVLTMTVGNVLGLLQFNVKRVFAYSSIAHTGYMLVGLTAWVATTDAGVRTQALSGVLFYLAAYGLMNAASFGVLMLLPARDPGGNERVGPSAIPSMTAETFEDLAGQGRRHPGLGLAMAVSCFSLIGLPLTVGFFGKYLLLAPALRVGTRPMNWLVIITVVNAAISAAYYLKIVATMFLRPDPTPYGAPFGATTGTGDANAVPFPRPVPVLAAVFISVAGTLVLGTIWPVTQRLNTRVTQAAEVDLLPTPAAAAPPVVTDAGTAIPQ